MERLLDGVRTTVRSLFSGLAKGLDRLSGGRLTPNMVTIFGLLMHLPIAWLIAQQSYTWAAVLLIIFGLFDTLDGALARVQGRSSNRGMFLDSTTDRVKEILIYIGIAYALVASGQPYMAVWAVAACGISLLVSYINAWGEVTLAGHKTSSHQTNQTLRSGLMSYDVRLALLALGLLLDQLPLAVVVVALLTFLTALQRINNVLRKFRA
jgi:phosphatidylglycerophosphate synthase